MRLNDEVNLAVQDRALALRLESDFTTDLARCERVTEPQWQRRPAAGRFGAVSSARRGRIYYFASREKRDRLEQAPERYAPGRAGAQPEGHAHHRHGC